MSELSRIHADKHPVRRHFLAEHLEARGMTPPELLTLLNESERSMELPRIDKSQVYRWLKGQLPQPKTQARIAEALQLDDPAELLRPPGDDWLARFFRERSEDEKARALQMLRAAFPEKTGT